MTYNLIAFRFAVLSGMTFMTAASAATMAAEGAARLSTIAPPTYLELVDANLSGEQAEQGWSVDISGHLAIVGAPFQSGGHALIFDLTTGALVHRLKGSDVSADHLFGFSVAIDGNLALVGSGQAPAAYVFDATTGQQLRKLSSSDPAFVRRVDISGGVAVLGMPSSDPRGPRNGGVGAATVFDARSGALLRRFDGPGGGFRQNFGDALAIEGNTLAIHSPTIFEESELQVFDVATGLRTWSYGVLEHGGRFEVRDLEIEGDLLAVGVGRRDDISEVLLFNRHTGALLNRIDTRVANENDVYKYSMDFSNGRVAVGSRGFYQDGIGYYVGAVHLFDALTGDRLATIENPAPSSFDGFGFAVALDGQHLLIGAPGEASNRGSAYAYRVPEPATACLALLLFPAIAAANRWGRVIFWENKGKQRGRSGSVENIRC